MYGCYTIVSYFGTRTRKLELCCVCVFLYFSYLLACCFCLQSALLVLNLNSSSWNIQLWSSHWSEVLQKWGHCTPYLCDDIIRKIAYLHFSCLGHKMEVFYLKENPFRSCHFSSKLGRELSTKTWWPQHLIMFVKTFFDQNELPPYLTIWQYSQTSL